MRLVEVADSDLQIREGAVMHPDPEMRGGFLEIFFRPFRPQFGPKWRGGPGSPGPSCRSTSELPTKSKNSIHILSLFKWYETLKENRTTLSRPLSRWTVMPEFESTHMFTYISYPICFSFHFKFPFFHIDESNMLRTFPLYQLDLQIPRHHRHKRPLA